MKEDFLHYIWKFKKLDFTKLYNTGGEKIHILKSGRHNPDAGPDFLEARLRIGGTVWAGHVEIHYRASDWRRHRHHQDKAYNNVILHVVYIVDEPTLNESGREIPVLEIREHVKRAVIRQYERLKKAPSKIACAPMIGDVAPHVLEPWLSRLLVERLERKTGMLHDFMQRSRGSWADSLYIMLARYFGMKVNAFPFERLAFSLPMKILMKHRHQLPELEALLFGQAGLLDGSFRDAYPCRLKEIYEYLKSKYGLTALNPENWRFMRMRPANFPSLRIAQLAALIHRHEHLQSAVIEADNYRECVSIFEVTASQYWDDHYRFDKSSKSRKKKLGKSMIGHLIMNVQIPYLFYYGAETARPELQERALKILEELPPEKNAKINEWEKLLPDFSIDSASQTQALLTLREVYCEPRRCLQCAIGHEVLKGNGKR